MISITSGLRAAVEIPGLLDQDALARLSTDKRRAIQMTARLNNPSGSAKTIEQIEKARELISKEVAKDTKLWRRLSDRWPCSRNTSM